ncbi:hypothetical protein G9A89_014030 [Geosiphon pyriformis]|nr:hypothetical protein G9A89_014030 [Geosiphon pyriformis]
MAIDKILTHHTEKKIGKTLGKIHLLLILLNLCPLYKGLHQNLQIKHLQNLIHKSIILQRISTKKHHPKVAESKNIKANHLGFAKSLFQYYCQYLGLNHNHISAKSVFNFYINEKISFLLETPVNTESARETFYKELIQNTNLPTNHNFASIITEINKEIEHHTQQRYPITYASKSKKKLQTPAVIPRKIQPPTWKKNRIESPSNLSYHYIPGSAINISLTDAFPSIATSAFGRFSFQRLRLLLPPPDFGISDLWEAAESEKEEEELEDQEFTYQHPITENLEVETPNFQTQQNNPNPELINQQNLPLVIVINQSPINPIAEPIQQPLQLPPQQPPLQPPNLDLITYTAIAKLNNFTGKEDNIQVWLNDDTANSWYQSLVNKSQDFNVFKAEFLRYFSNNNSINHLVNTFTIIKQGEIEVILNQFIYGLCSSILQHVHPLHPDTLQDTVTCTRDFESTELKANHTQAINLIMNGSSELDSKLEKFSKSINKRLERYLADNHAIYQSPQ